MIQLKLNENMKRINKKINRKYKSKKTPVNKNPFTWFPVITPLIYLLLYVSLAAHCRWVVGHWPQPMIENVNVSSYKIHEAILNLFMYAVFLSIPVWIITLFIKKFRITFKIHLLQFIIFGLGILLIILAFRLDPTSFTEWFLD